VVSSPTAPSRPFPALRAVLFDADHTLLDTARAEQAALRQALRPLGIPCPATVVLTYRRINLGLWEAYRQGKIDQARLAIERFRLLLDELGRDPAPAGRLARSYLDAFSRRGDLYPACRQTLRVLGQRYRLGVVTNGIDRVQRRRLRAAALDRAFEVVVTSEASGFVKPDPRIMAVALRELGVRAAQALYVGDDDSTDGMAARRAGMAFCLMQHGGAPSQAHQTGRATSLRELGESLLQDPGGSAYRAVAARRPVG